MDSRFTVLERVGFDDHFRFVRIQCLHRVSWVSFCYQLISVLFVAVWVRVGIQSGEDFSSLVTEILQAVFMCALLIPVHEMIHAIASITTGARDIRVKASVRRLQLSAIAHRHVIGMREFIWISILPFFLITGLVAILVGIIPDRQFVIMGALTMHTLCCASDWANLNYAWGQRRTEVYTFEDADEGARYFLTMREASG